MSIVLSCTAGINYDYISTKHNGRHESFALHEPEKLKQFLKDNTEDIIIERDRNVFANRPLTDEEFARFQNVIAQAQTA